MNLPTNKKDWSSVMSEADSYEKFMELCQLHYPRDYVLNHERLEYFGKKHFAAKAVPYVSPFTEFILPFEVQEWLDNEFNSEKRRKKSLVLIGPSKLGKTEWARSLGEHMYFNHLANFKEDWNANAKYIIFDDFEWEFIPNKKGFFGGQLNFQISGKYMKVKTVTWGKCCIYLANSFPIIQKERDWYDENCVFVQINNKFFYLISFALTPNYLP